MTASVCRNLILHSLGNVFFFFHIFIYSVLTHIKICFTVFENFPKWVHLWFWETCAHPARPLSMREHAHRRLILNLYWHRSFRCKVVSLRCSYMTHIWIDSIESRHIPKYLSSIYFSHRHDCETEAAWTMFLLQSFLKREIITFLYFAFQGNESDCLAKRLRSETTGYRREHSLSLQHRLITSIFSKLSYRNFHL